MAVLSPSPALAHFGAIILAGGMSRRMGSPKALLDLDGESLICRIIHAVQEVSAIRGIIVVTGHEAQKICDAVSPVDAISFIHNPKYETGEMLSSVKAGVSAVHDSWDGFFLMLLDQPAVSCATLAKMIDVWALHHPPIVIPTYHEQHGHPLLISSRYVAEILSLPDGATLRDFVSQHRTAGQKIEVDDPGVTSDVDTLDDYHRVLELWRKRSEQPA